VKPVEATTPVEAETVYEVTYEVSNMAEVDDSTFHLTYMDGKEITFQVHEENVSSPRKPRTVGRGDIQYGRIHGDSRSHIENLIQTDSRVTQGIEESKAEMETQQATEEIITPEGVDKDNHHWGLYMRAQYSGYKDTEDLLDSDESLLIDENEPSILRNEILTDARRSRTTNHPDNKNAVGDGLDDHDYLTPQLEETNVAETDREVRRLAREEARVKGLAQAKEKARLAKEKLAKRLSLIQATKSQAETELPVDQDATANTTEDRDDDQTWNETDGENEEMDGEQKVVLINTGPHNNVRARAIIKRNNCVC
jgi:DNA-binding phage protein